MAFCATCGSPVEGRFCAKCGSAVASGGAGTPAGAVPAGPVAQPIAAAQPMTDNVASMLCYLAGLITGIIFLVIAPYNQNKTVRFHAFQSIFFHVACIVFFYGLSFVLSALFVAMHIFGLAFLFTPLLGLCLFGLWIYLMISAYQGKKVVLPIIGNIAQSQA